MRRNSKGGDLLHFVKWEESPNFVRHWKQHSSESKLFIQKFLETANTLTSLWVRLTDSSKGFKIEHLNWSDSIIMAVLRAVWHAIPVSLSLLWISRLSIDDRFASLLARVCCVLWRVIQLAKWRSILDNQMQANVCRVLLEMLSDENSLRSKLFGNKSKPVGDSQIETCWKLSNRMVWI